MSIGPSGDLYPESRSDHVPPVHLDHSGRSDHDGQYPVSTRSPLHDPPLNTRSGIRTIVVPRSV